MKKIVYIAPLALLGVGIKASANQVPTHISNALRIYEQENMQSQPIGQSKNEQAKPALPNGQNQPVIKTRQARQTAHISHLDMGVISNAKDGSDVDKANNQNTYISHLDTGSVSTESPSSKIKQTKAIEETQTMSINQLKITPVEECK